MQKTDAPAPVGATATEVLREEHCSTEQREVEDAHRLEALRAAVQLAAADIAAGRFKSADQSQRLLFKVDHGLQGISNRPALQLDELRAGFAPTPVLKRAHADLPATCQFGLVEHGGGLGMGCLGLHERESVISTAARRPLRVAADRQTVFLRPEHGGTALAQGHGVGSASAQYASTM